MHSAPRRSASTTRSVKQGFWLLLAVVVVLGLGLGWWLSPFGRPAPEPAVTPAAGGASTTQITDLQPGDCLAEFDSAWSETFKPADCAQPHPAEYLGAASVESVFDEAPADWPGEVELRERAMLACQSPELLDLAAAADASGLVIEARWPASAAEWASGMREYHCFAVASEGSLTDTLGP